MHFQRTMLFQQSMLSKDSSFRKIKLSLRFSCFTCFTCLWNPSTKRAPIYLFLCCNIALCVFLIFEFAPLKKFQNFESNYKNVNWQQWGVFCELWVSFLSSVSDTWYNHMILVAGFCHLVFTPAQLLRPKYSSNALLENWLSEGDASVLLAWAERRSTNNHNKN